MDLEVDGLASRSSQLITTDQVNRDGTLNPSLAGYINYRANQGSAHYAGLSTVIRFRKTRVHGQLAYTVNGNPERTAPSPENVQLRKRAPTFCLLNIDGGS